MHIIGFVDRLPAAGYTHKSRAIHFRPFSFWLKTRRNNLGLC